MVTRPGFFSTRRKSGTLYGARSSLLLKTGMGIMPHHPPTEAPQLLHLPPRPPYAPRWSSALTPPEPQLERPAPQSPPPKPRPQPRPRHPCRRPPAVLCSSDFPRSRLAPRPLPLPEPIHPQHPPPLTRT